MADQARRNTGKKSGNTGMIKTLFLGILLGLAVAGVMAWYLVPRQGDFRKQEPAPKVQPPAPPVKAPKPAKSAPSPATEPAPVAHEAKPPAPAGYTFYDILPGNQPPEPLPPVPVKEQWWLQVAALKNAEAADELRARLTLLNLNVVIRDTTGDNVLHRVRVGPFDSQAIAEKARERLVANNFEARMLKEPVTQPVSQ